MRGLEWGLALWQAERADRVSAAAMRGREDWRVSIFGLAFWGWRNGVTIRERVSIVAREFERGKGHGRNAPMA